MVRTPIGWRPTFLIARERHQRWCHFALSRFVLFPSVSRPTTTFATVFLRIGNAWVDQIASVHLWTPWQGLARLIQSRIVSIKLLRSKQFRLARSPAPLQLF
jgi:hypothetical protein